MNNNSSSGTQHLASDGTFGDEEAGEQNQAGQHSHRTPPSIIQLTQPDQAVSGTAGVDRFVFHSLAEKGAVISHFTVGQDYLRFAGHDVDTGRLSLTAHPGDATSTDVIVDAGTATAHTLATLTGVKATDVASLIHNTGSAATEDTAESDTADTTGGSGTSVDGANDSPQTGGSADPATTGATGNSAAGTSTNSDSTAAAETSTASVATPKYSLTEI